MEKLVTEACRALLLFILHYHKLVMHNFRWQPKGYGSRVFVMPVILLGPGKGVFKDSEGKSGRVWKGHGG